MRKTLIITALFTALILLTNFCAVGEEFAPQGAITNSLFNPDGKSGGTKITITTNFAKKTGLPTINTDKNLTNQTLLSSHITVPLLPINYFIEYYNLPIMMIYIV